MLAKYLLKQGFNCPWAAGAPTPGGWATLDPVWVPVPAPPPPPRRLWGPRDVAGMDANGSLEPEATFPCGDCSTARALLAWPQFLYARRLRKNKIKHLKQPSPPFRPPRVNGGASGGRAPAPAESPATKQTRRWRGQKHFMRGPSSRAVTHRPGRSPAPAPPPPRPAEDFLKLINETCFIYGPIGGRGLCKAFISST